MKKSISNDVYDKIADEYSDRIDTKPHNAYYDRPAVQSLIYDIKGQRILDAGCGPGVYAEWLLEKGAKVVGFDASTKMLENSKKRLGNKLDLIHANMEEPLSFLEDNSFDGILSALAVTYVRDLDFLFKEFNRVLKINSWFVFSTEHPFFTYNYHEMSEYFKTKRVEATWWDFGKNVEMPSYYHSLGTIADALTDNGFIIEKILEAKPVDDFRRLSENEFKKLNKNPAFINFRAKKIQSI